MCFYLRAKWLKESNPEAEELFRMVAEVFIFWSKSHVSYTETISHMNHHVTATVSRKHLMS